jgi:uncharacterized membrane protein YphA (DoxX/SURF4 family)
MVKMVMLQAPLVLLARLMLVFIFIVEGWGRSATMPPRRNIWQAMA